VVRILGHGAAVACAVAVFTSGCATMRSSDELEVRRIAILPFAYRGVDDAVPCSVCPDQLDPLPTSREDALLVTAFFHEALTTYPRLSILPFEAVDRLLVDDMVATMDRLYAAEEVDAVLVGMLMALRPREGDPREPDAPAGASIYAALVEPLTERVFWVGTREGVQQPPPITLRRLSEIISGEPIRWHSDLGQAQLYANELVKEMVKQIH